MTDYRYVVAASARSSDVAHIAVDSPTLPWIALCGAPVDHPHVGEADVCGPCDDERRLREYERSGPPRLLGSKVALRAYVRRAMATGAAR